MVMEDLPALGSVLHHEFHASAERLNRVTIDAVSWDRSGSAPDPPGAPPHAAARNSAAGTDRFMDLRGGEALET
jgi:hypothetical protein